MFRNVWEWEDECGISLIILTYPPYINCDIVITHNRHEPPKDYL